MDVNTTRALTGSETDLSGRIAGAVLKALRASAGLTQEQFAERLGSGVTTVQGWETGRRPLINARYGEVQRVRRLLRTAGATAAQLAVFDQALTADTVMAEIGSLDVDTHPLALVVPDRTLTELLAWPLTAVPPRQLAGTTADLRVEAGIKDQLAADLRAVVDRAGNGLAGAMLRRQAKYLVAAHEPSRGWLANITARDVRSTRGLRDWTPQWAVIRSHAVSAAAAGDLDPLERFVREGLATDQDIAANLHYWAYWVGEVSTRWSSDADMLEPDQTWGGGALLASLLDGLENAPYRELCAHALWALLRHRRSLIDNPATRTRVTAVIDTVASTEHALSPDAKRRLDQIVYLAGS